MVTSTSVLRCSRIQSKFLREKTYLSFVSYLVLFAHHLMTSFKPESIRQFKFPYVSSALLREGVSKWVGLLVRERTVFFIFLDIFFVSFLLLNVVDIYICLRYLELSSSLESMVSPFSRLILPLRLFKACFSEDAIV